MNSLSLEEIENIKSEYSKNVKVDCDENHAHSALKNCLGGDKESIIICKLCESLIHLKETIRKLEELSK